MSREIQDEIRENREDTTRALAADRQPTRQTEQVLSVGSVPVEVEATVTVYTRPINDSIIVGHPDQPQGWGAGVVGDDRGVWSQQATTTTVLTQDGKRSVAGTVVGDGTEIDELDVGDVVNQAFDLKDGFDTTLFRSSFRAGESPPSVDTVTLGDSASRTVVDASISSVAADIQTEVRVDVSLSFAPDSSDEQAVTATSKIADATRRVGDERLTELALGTDDTTPAQSDTALGNSVIQKNGRGSTIGGRARLETVVFRGEPGTQPHDIKELGLFSADGTLVARATFGAETKDDRIRLRATGGIDIR